MTLARPHFVTVGTQQSRLWQAGAGAPVVVLPGLVQAASEIAGRLARLAPELGCFVFELPGTGGSAEVAFDSLDEVAAALQAAIEAAGLRDAPVLAFDLATPIARLLQGRRVFVDVAPAQGWAARMPSLPGLAPRADGTHLNALFAHLRDAHVLDACSGRRAAREGNPLPSPEALDAMLLAASARPAAYARLWSLCCDGMRRRADERGAASLEDALAQLRAQATAAPVVLARPAPTPSIWRDHVHTPRGRVHVRQSGPDRSPLIALHSAPGSAAPLQPLLHGLGARRRVIAPDYIGNGDSDKVDTPVDIATLAQDTLAVADALGLRRFDLWGTHTGALIALEAALIAPERIGRVILEAPPLLAPDFTADLLAHYFPALPPDGWGLYLQQAWNMRRDMFLFWPWYRAERAAARPLDVPEASFLHDWVVGLLSSGATYHRTYRAAFEYDTPSRLPLLRRPALVCAGPADMLAEGLRTARSLLGPAAAVSSTPATVWYPGQDRQAVDATIAMYAQFLDAPEEA
ncbi:MAG: alpha/beta hydrolase [Variovorax sp.]|nr:alpha/beta hydrolase [Variovorax sp.]